MYVPILERRCAGYHPVGGQLIVGVELGEPTVLEDEILAEPEIDPVSNEQLALLRELFFVLFGSPSQDLVDLLVELFLAVGRTEFVAFGPLILNVVVAGAADLFLLGDDGNSIVAVLCHGVCDRTGLFVSRICGYADSHRG